MSIYDFQVTKIGGETIDLSVYLGKVLLIVNTASKCSYSRQFADLQKLYDNHREQGFEILGFPCNQFNEKEPGSNSEVQEYCTGHFGVTFPLFEKVEVRGQNPHPLFEFLTNQAPFQGFDTQTVNGQWMQNFLQKSILTYTQGMGSSGISQNF